MSISVKDLTDEQILDIIDNCRGDFWHKEDYYVTEKCYVDENYEYHHTEFVCERGDEKWLGCPHDIIGNITHIDELYDEMFARGKV